MSALEDMTNYAAIAQAHAQAMQRLVAAFEPLYTRFTPAQREAARQALRPAPSRVAARHQGLYIAPLAPPAGTARAPGDIR